MSLSLQTINDKEFRYITQWANKQGYDSSHIPLSLGAVLPKYFPSNPNHWLVGPAPDLELNRFLMIDSKLKVTAISSPLIEKSLCKISSLPEVSYIHSRRTLGQRLLVYLEEYKGVSSKWVISSEKPPQISKLSINSFRVKFGRKEFQLVDSLSYNGVPIQRKFSGTDTTRVAGYSFVV